MPGPFPATVPGVAITRLYPRTYSGNTGYYLFDGVCKDSSNRIYAVTGSQPAGNRVLRWANPYDATAYDISSSFPLVGNNRISDLAYDVTRECLYFGMCITGFNPFTFSILKTALPALTTTTLVNQVALPGSYPTTTYGDNSALCTDGTYIYVAIMRNTANALVYKFACSNGTLVAGPLTIDNAPTSGNSKNGTIIELQTGNGVGNLLVGGPGGNPLEAWVAQVPTSLASTTAIVNVTGCSLLDDDRIPLGDYFWVADEQTTASSNSVWRVANDCSSQTQLVTNATQGIDGLATDGTYIYALSRFDNGLVDVIDPSTVSIVRTFSAQPPADSLGNSWNEIQVIPGGYFLMTSGVGSDGVAVFQPTGVW